MSMEKVVKTHHGQIQNIKSLVKDLSMPGDRLACILDKDLPIISVHTKDITGNVIYYGGKEELTEVKKMIEKEGGTVEERIEEEGDTVEESISETEAVVNSSPQADDDLLRRGDSGLGTTVVDDTNGGDEYDFNDSDIISSTPQPPRKVYTR